jgi:hypothetical protein
VLANVAPSLVHSAQVIAGVLILDLYEFALLPA